MSCQTSTWASQPGPAPIPIVGMVRLAVTRAASSAGTASSTTENAPAACIALASCSRRSPSSPRPWTRYPPKALTDCGVRPRWAMTGMPAATRSSTCRSTRWPPSSLTAWAPASLRNLAALASAISGEPW